MGGFKTKVAHRENRLVFLPKTFGERKWCEARSDLSLSLSLSVPRAEVLLQRHGGRAAGFSEVPAPPQTQTPAARHGENGGGHQHAHLQRPQTARERDHGVKWESQSLFHPLSSSEEFCRDTGERGGGKW